jgi:hypothetical protein
VKASRRGCAGPSHTSALNVTAVIGRSRQRFRMKNPKVFVLARAKIGVQANATFQAVTESRDQRGYARMQRIGDAVLDLPAWETATQIGQSMQSGVLSVVLKAVASADVESLS